MFDTQLQTIQAQRCVATASPRFGAALLLYAGAMQSAANVCAHDVSKQILCRTRSRRWPTARRQPRA